MDRGYVYRGQKELSKDLLDKYGSVALRPVTNASQSIQVYFRILIAQVISFNEKEQRITINGWRKLQWLDQFLAWDKELYGGINQLEVTPDKIWLPDIKLYENIDKDFQSEDKVNALVSSDGMVTWYTPMVISSSCKINVRYFPFDVQTCTLTFGSWAYTIDSLNINYSDDATQNVFLNNGVWDLRKINLERNVVKYACCPFPFSFVQVDLFLERRYEFYVFNMVVPCVMLSAINALVFLVPPESGEKISFSVANLLASILFQQLIGELMPPLGDEIPLLGMFFLYMVGMSCVALGASVLILRMFHRLGEKPVPRWLKRMFLHRDSVSLSFKRASVAVKKTRSNRHSSNGDDGYRRGSNLSMTVIKENVNDVNSKDPDEASFPLHPKNDVNSTAKLSIHCQGFNDDYESESAMLKREVIRQEWMTVARKLDKSLGALVAGSTLLVIILIFLLFVFRG
ncbi:neuronal acetylcholine receptor subunit alpha-10-like [Lytechinus variegatus]|uniref:neuronal acetylcholine receptor subunit alpha-10-like n=1 Tax=Lytechinus variegatus TaxID=7654 RepID=UPI001BB20E3B|nr:neuronal acetylcholine receptor subunit alpha-10-like [Lytechinus variegatus]